MRFKDITGKRHGRLVAIRPLVIKRHSMVWLCQCDCGKTTEVQARHLGGKIGIRSCGCLLAEANRRRPVRHATNMTHGESGRTTAKRTPEYIAWFGMRQRCSNPKFNGFHNYGGRGITVCERWDSSYEAFLADMGRRPSPGHSLDRIDPDGNYEPSNCRWATMKVQQNNRRDTRWGTVNGVRMPAAEISRRHKVSDRTVHNWLNRLGDGAELSGKIAAYKPLSRPRLP